MQWSQIDEFPQYSINERGDVIRWPNKDRPLAPSRNQQGVVKVGLFHEGRQYSRSVAVLVAKAFLEPWNDRCDTVIHLDGDKENCELYNLEWRPRWFAIKYHHQFEPGYVQGFTVPIEDMDSGRVFANGMAAAMEFGILDKEIVYAVQNNTHVFPTGQRFRLVE